MVGGARLSPSLYDSKPGVLKADLTQTYRLCFHGDTCLFARSRGFGVQQRPYTHIRCSSSSPSTVTIYMVARRSCTLHLLPSLFHDPNSPDAPIPMFLELHHYLLRRTWDSSCLWVAGEGDCC